MTEIDDLRNKFSIPGILSFAPANGGLIAAQVTTPAADATIYMHGAHLAHWQPAGQRPVLFLSSRAEFAPGKAIRGGVPVIFPWFGPRHDGKPGPQHGFARTSEWELAFAAMAGDELHLAFTLAPGDLSRSLGFDHFRVGYRMILGHTLTLELTVANDADGPLVFEEALHTYYAVADARQVSIGGLGGTTYIDKMEGAKRKLQPEGALHLNGETDRAYLNTAATCTLDDPADGRRIVIEKNGSHSTVVWNPWRESTAKMADMEPDAWLRMACVETANVADNAVTLPPGATHTMQLTVLVEAR
jgi:glucose-6-phosphate 1-epimerase